MQCSLDVILEVNKIIVIGVQLRMLMMRGKEDMLSLNFSFLVSVCMCTCMYHAHL